MRLPAFSAIEVREAYSFMLRKFRIGVKATFKHIFENPETIEDRLLFSQRSKVFLYSFNPNKMRTVLELEDLLYSF